MAPVTIPNVQGATTDPLANGDPIMSGEVLKVLLLLLTMTESVSSGGSGRR